MTPTSLATSLMPAMAGLTPAAGDLSADAFSDHFGKAADFKAQLKKKIADASDPQKQAEDAAAGLISQALIMPILKQVRRSPFNEKGPFSPGTAEKSFGPQFDMQLADRIAHSPQMGVTKALAARLLKASGNRAAPQAATKGEAISVHG